MTKKTLTGSEKLDKLTEALVEDVLGSSDRDIIDEAKELFGDPEAEADRIRDVLDGAIARASKARLAEARKEVAAHKRSHRENNVVPISAATKREAVNRFIARDKELQNKLTLAARKGEGIESENDIDGMFDDLVRLGIIDEQGNPK